MIQAPRTFPTWKHPYLYLWLLSILQPQPPDILPLRQPQQDYYS